MGIFKDLFSTGNTSGTPQPPKQPEQPPQLHRFTYVLQKHFRGYKRFYMVVYGDKESERNNEKFSGDLSGKEITFVESYNPKHYYAVYLDNKKIGAIFDQNEVEQLTTLMITAVYAKVEEETVIDKIQGAITRKRIRLFVKYSEQ